MTAAIDGRETPFAAAGEDGISIEVPAGRHEIAMSYQPAGLAAGTAVSALAAAALPFLLAAPLFSALATRSRRQQFPRGFPLPSVRRRRRIRMPVDAAIAAEEESGVLDRRMSPAAPHPAIRPPAVTTPN